MTTRRRRPLAPSVVRRAARAATTGAEQRWLGWTGADADRISMIEGVRRQVERFVGPLGMRRAQLLRPWRRLTTEHNLEYLARLGEIPSATDDPVIVMAATWRSGSTLLQRLVVSSGEVLVWGEPWNRCDLVPTLRGSLQPFDGDWPGDAGTVPDGTAAELSDRWIANLFPTVGDLVESHRALFRRQYAEPARSFGVSRWGVKAVRYGVDDARYLRFLFPSARLVFVLRDPVDAWRSYRSFNLRSYVRWPDEPVITATHFGRLWRDRVGAFLDHAHELDALVVRYEDLNVDRSTIDALDRHLGVAVDRSVLDSVVGGTDPAPLDPLDAWRLRRTIGATAQRAGYDRPALAVRQRAVR